MTRKNLNWSSGMWAGLYGSEGFCTVFRVSCFCYLSRAFLVSEQRSGISNFSATPPRFPSSLIHVDTLCLYVTCPFRKKGAVFSYTSNCSPHYGLVLLTVSLRNSLCNGFLFTFQRTTFARINNDPIKERYISNCNSFPSSKFSSLFLSLSLYSTLSSFLSSSNSLPRASTRSFITGLIHG